MLPQKEHIRLSIIGIIGPQSLYADGSISKRALPLILSRNVLQPDVIIGAIDADFAIDGYEELTALPSNSTNLCWRNRAVAVLSVPTGAIDCVWIITTRLVSSVGCFVIGAIALCWAAATNASMCWKMPSHT